MTAEEVKRTERAVGQFNTCDHAGANISIEVNKEKGTKAVLGYCSHERRQIDIEPTCRICIRHTRKKKKSYKKTAATRARIKKGRLRQKQRQKEREDPNMRKPGLRFFTKRLP